MVHVVTAVDRMSRKVQLLVTTEVGRMSHEGFDNPLHVVRVVNVEL